MKTLFSTASNKMYD